MIIIIVAQIFDQSFEVPPYMAEALTTIGLGSRYVNNITYIYSERNSAKSKKNLIITIT